jgi:hypothetical protein
MRNSGIMGSQIASSIAAAVAGAGAGPSTISNFIARAFKDSITISDLNAFGAPAPLPLGFSRAGKLHFFGQEVPVQLYKKEGKDQLVVRVKSTGQFVSGFNGWTIKGNELVWKRGEPVPQITTEIGAQRLANAVAEVPEIMNIANDVIAPRVADAFRNALGNQGTPPPGAPRRQLRNGNHGRGTIIETRGGFPILQAPSFEGRASNGQGGGSGSNSENNFTFPMPPRQPRPVRRVLFPEGGQGGGPPQGYQYNEGRPAGSGGGNNGGGGRPPIRRPAGSGGGNTGGGGGPPGGQGGGGGNNNGAPSNTGANNGGNNFPNFIPSNKNVGNLTFKYIATVNGHINALAKFKKVKNAFEKEGYYRAWVQGNGANLPGLVNFVNSPNLGRNVNYKFGKGANGIGYHRSDTLPGSPPPRPGGGIGGFFRGLFGGPRAGGGGFGGPPRRFFRGGGGGFPRNNNNENRYERMMARQERNASLRYSRGAGRPGSRSIGPNQVEMQNKLRRLMAERLAGTSGSRAPRGGPTPAPTEREQVAEKFANMMTSNEKSAINNMGGSSVIQKILRESGGPIELEKASTALKKFPNKNMAIQMTGASPNAINAVMSIGGPNRANVILSVNHKLNVAQSSVRKARKAKRARKAKLAAPANRVRATLLKAMVKKFTKDEIVKIAGENALGSKNNKNKNTLVKNFTKYVRRQPKKKRSVAGPKRKSTK